MNVIGYTRVSTLGQAERGVSLDAQKDRIEKWAAANDHTILRFYCDEGLSGKDMKHRPAMRQAVADAIQNKAALVGYSLSRLFRSARDAEETAVLLNKNGARLVSLTESIDTESAVGMLIFQVLSAFSQFEREIIAERTTCALSHRRSKGIKISRHAPVGFEFQGDKVVECPREQEAIRFVREMRLNGATLYRIQKAMFDAGYIGRGGKLWSVATIRKMLA